MSALIKSEIIIFFIMAMAGITTGILVEVFNIFIALKRIKGIGYLLLSLILYMCIAFMFGEYLFYCDNGKITFLSIVSFIIGLVLWKKIFCVILKR